MTLVHLFAVSSCESSSLNLSWVYHFENITLSQQTVKSMITDKIESIKNELCSPPCSSYHIDVENVIPGTLNITITVPGVQ